MHHARYCVIITIFLSGLVATLGNVDLQESEFQASLMARLVRREEYALYHRRGLGNDKSYRRLREESPPRSKSPPPRPLSPSSRERSPGPSSRLFGQTEAGSTHLRIRPGKRGPDGSSNLAPASSSTNQQPTDQGTVHSGRGQTAKRAQLLAETRIKAPLEQRIAQAVQGSILNSNRISADSTKAPSSGTPLLGQSEKLSSGQQRPSGSPARVPPMRGFLQSLHFPWIGNQFRSKPPVTDSRAHASVETKMPPGHTADYGFTKTPSGRIKHTEGEPGKWELKGVSHLLKASAGGKSPAGGQVEATAQGKFTGVRLRVKEGGQGYVQPFYKNKPLTKLTYEPKDTPLNINLRPDESGAMTGVVAGVIGPGSVKAKGWNQEKRRKEGLSEWHEIGDVGHLDINK